MSPRRRILLVLELSLVAAPIAALGVVLGVWGWSAGSNFASVMSGGMVVFQLVVTGLTRDKSPDHRLAGIAAIRMVSIASLIAGRKRPALRGEWQAHLAGNSGHDPASWQKVRQAAGFVLSAVKYRASDAADAAWVPVDAILKSRTLSNLLVMGICAAAMAEVDRYEGRLGVVMSAESLIGIGGLVYGLIRVGRWYRDVEPPEPKARRAKSGSGQDGEAD